MFIIFWLISWLLRDNLTFTFGTGGAFWALIVAVVADVFIFGYWGRTWFRRP